MKGMSRVRREVWRTTSIRINSMNYIFPIFCLAFTLQLALPGNSLAFHQSPLNSDSVLTVSPNCRETESEDGINSASKLAFTQRVPQVWASFKYGTKLTATYNYDYAQRLTSVVNSYYDHTVYPPNPKVAPAVDSISQIFRQRFWNYLDKFFGVGEAQATNQPTGPYDVWNTRSKSVYTLDGVGNRLANTTNAGLNTYSYNNIYEKIIEKIIVSEDVK